MKEAIVWLVSDPIKFGVFCWVCGAVAGWMAHKPPPMPKTVIYTGAGK